VLFKNYFSSQANAILKEKNSAENKKVNEMAG